MKRQLHYKAKKVPETPVQGSCKNILLLRSLPPVSLVKSKLLQSAEGILLKERGFLINMEGYTNWQDLKRELLNDPQTRSEVEAQKPKFDIIRTIIAARQAKGLSQAALAERIGTHQSAIARLESGSYNPTVQFLEKIARALDAELTISFTPR